MFEICLRRVGQKKLDNFGKFVTDVYDDTERLSIYETVQYLMWSKTGTLNFVTVKYSLH